MKTPTNNNRHADVENRTDTPPVSTSDGWNLPGARHPLLRRGERVGGSFRRGFFIFSFCALQLASLSFALPDASSPEDKVLSKAFSAFMDGDDKQALSYFEEALRINPKNRAAQRGFDKVRIRLRRAHDVEKTRGLSLAKARTNEGKRLLQTDDTVAAIDSFQAALDASPDYQPAKKRLDAIRKETEKWVDRRRLNLTAWAFARGTLAYLDKDWAKAWRIWSERSQIEPSNIPLANATARAENKFRTMMISEQEDFFRRSARAFYAQGLYPEAKVAWARVTSMRADDQEALEGVARSEEAILRAQGKNKDSQAHDVLEEGLEHYSNQEWRKALEAFTRLLQLDPSFTTARDYIAKINRQLQSSSYSPAPSGDSGLFKQQRPSNTAGDAVSLPDNAKNFEDSKSQLKAQLSRDPTSITAQQELDRVNKQQEEESERVYKDGLIAYSQGNRTLAIQQWKKVLVINPDHKKAAAALRKARAEEERTDTGEKQ